MQKYVTMKIKKTLKKKQDEKAYCASKFHGILNRSVT